MSKRTQAGFSLLELLVAMMIIAVLGTIGFKGVKNYMDEARYTKVREEIRAVGEALDLYEGRRGRYPEVGSWEELVKDDSPLVKANLLKPGISPVGPWDQPIEVKISKSMYEIKFAGDPNNPDSRGPIVRTPVRSTAAGQDQGGGSKPEPKAEGAPK